MSIGFACDYTQVRPNIYVKPTKKNPHFVSGIDSCISHLEKTVTGKRLLEKIGDSTHAVFIKHGPLVVLPLNGNCYEQGVGCDSIVQCSMLVEDYLCLDSGWSAWDGIGLVQGLVEGYHNCKGKNASQNHHVDKLVWKTDEHYHAIMGFPSKKAERKTPKITVNSILIELHRPARFSSHHYETLERKLLWKERVELALQVYHRTCLEMKYDKNSNLPPPIANCTCEDLKHSEIVIALYHCIAQKVLKRTVSKSIINNHGEMVVEWSRENLEEGTVKKFYEPYLPGHEDRVVKEEKEFFECIDVILLNSMPLEPSQAALGVYPPNFLPAEFLHPDLFQVKTIGYCRLSNTEKRAIEIEQREESALEERLNSLF